MAPQEPQSWLERVLAVLAEILSAAVDLVDGRPLWTVAALALGIVLALWLFGRVLRVVVVAALVVALLLGAAFFAVGPERAHEYLQRLSGAPVEASESGR